MTSKILIATDGCDEIYAGVDGLRYDAHRAYHEAYDQLQDDRGQVGYLTIDKLYTSI